MKLKRGHYWFAIIVASVLLVVMAPSDEGGGSGKGRHAYRSNSRAGGSDKDGSHKTGRVELELLSRLEMKQHKHDKISDVFNQTPWYVAPPPSDLPVETLKVPVIPPPPPAPVAPALPFTYLGRYGDTPARTVVLAKGDKVYTVKVGDVIDKTYRVEKYTKGKVNLTYLPLHVEQSLPTGEAL
jgi:hypothetical protein